MSLKGSLQQMDARVDEMDRPTNDLVEVGRSNTVGRTVR